MFTVSEETWPIVVMEAAGSFQLSEAEDYIAAWERWLARNEPMALLIVAYNEKNEKADKAATKLGNDWLLANKARIGQQCAGVAVVIKASAMFMFWKPIVSHAMKKRMGCPGQAFTDETEAKAWLNKQLTSFKLQQ